MYKAPLTASVFSSFASKYQSFSSTSQAQSVLSPYVYVDANGFKLVANIVDDSSAAQDGWMEMLALY